MQCIILAAWKWERLKPITDTIPKPLIKINQTSLLENTIKILSPSMKNISVVIWYMWQQIIDTIGHKNSWVSINYVQQQKWITWTLWALISCIDILENEFIVISADNIYHSNDIKRLCKSTQNTVLMYKEEIEKTLTTPIYKYGNSVLWSDIFEQTEKYKYINSWSYKLSKEILWLKPIKIEWSNEYSIPHTLLQLWNNIHFIFTNYWFPVWNQDELAYIRTHAESYKL